MGVGLSARMVGGGDGCLHLLALCLLFDVEGEWGSGMGWLQLLALCLPKELCFRKWCMMKCEEIIVCLKR